jgi:predicted Zn-dependent protease
MAAGILAEMTAPLIASLEKLLDTPRDGALLRYSLGREYLKAGGRERGIALLRDAVRMDPGYSAAWKSLGAALAESGSADEARAAYAQGIEAARARGDRQAEKEMTVFARRLDKARGA